MGDVTQMRQRECAACGGEARKRLVWIEGTRRDAMFVCPTCETAVSLAIPERVYAVRPHEGSWRAEDPASP